MTDIRQRLTDALREHQPSPVGFCSLEGCSWRYWPGHDHQEHQIAVLLSLPGIAIVELPEPDDYGDRWDIPSCGEFKGVKSTGDSVVSVQITDQGIDVDTFGEMTPLEARLLAAAILAAAVVASADAEPAD